MNYYTSSLMKIKKIIPCKLKTEIDKTLMLFARWQLTLFYMT